MKYSLVSMLESYREKKNISFAMPGHKGGRGIPEPLKSGFFGLDVTELDETDNMHEPGEVLSGVLAETAEFFGADESFILVNGSTSGIFTMLMSCCRRGDTVAVNRGCHTSVINACIVLGLNPVFIRQTLIDELNVPDAVSSIDVEKLLQKEKASAVLITSPDYYGFTADISEIAKVTEKFNIPLLVDEAHGAHFAAAEDIFPKPALLSGADMCVQSAHKTLNACNQTAFLHVKNKRVDIGRVKKCFGVFQTTSPSYPLIASADLAKTELALRGREMWGRVHKNCMRLRKSLKEYAVSPDRSWAFRYNFSDVDECRLLFNISAYEMTGYKLAEKLRKEYKIDIEMADLYQIVLIPTPSNTDKEFEILNRAMIEILSAAKKRKDKPQALIPPVPEKVMFPSEAFYTKGCLCGLDEARGRIAKASVIPYPPGIPAVIPGERINTQTVEYIKILQKNGAVIHGVKDGMIETVLP